MEVMEARTEDWGEYLLRGGKRWDIFADGFRLLRQDALRTPPRAPKIGIEVRNILGEMKQKSGMGSDWWTVWGLRQTQLDLLDDLGVEIGRWDNELIVPILLLINMVALFGKPAPSTWREAHYPICDVV